GGTRRPLEPPPRNRRPVDSIGTGVFRYPCGEVDLRGFLRRRLPALSRPAAQDRARAADARAGAIPRDISGKHRDRIHQPNATANQSLTWRSTRVARTVRLDS